MKKKPLNKENLLKFADDLYKEEKSYIHYRPMCTSSLAKKNGEVTCCVLGEMYEFFTGKPVFKDSAKGVKILTNEGNIVEELTQLAVLKPVESEWAEAENAVGFKMDLDNLPEVNDTSGENEDFLYQALKDKEYSKKTFKQELERSYIERAKYCSEELKRMANEYLV